MSAGYRGLLAPWIGGAGSVGQHGYRGLMAFWVGGASALAPITPPPPPPPEVEFNLGYATAYRFPVDRLAAQRLEEDELIVLVIAQALPLLH